ncbi:hypothetical protein [Neisseria elongata]|jgi:hypothetical protein|uniref:hypothetical protein n=1 Tax=Neisseria elongata TaxID=495 RepID=UPI000D377F90|nr:hypothetical protein [Neisseria elongata]
MAANKRPHKKYSPKRNPLAVSNEPLKDREVAEMAAWKHYVRAIKESEPILDAEAHRKRKKQEG